MQYKKSPYQNKIDQPYQNQKTKATDNLGNFDSQIPNSNYPQPNPSYPQQPNYGVPSPSSPNDFQDPYATQQFPSPPPPQAPTNPYATQQHNLPLQPPYLPPNPYQQNPQLQPPYQNSNTNIYSQNQLPQAPQMPKYPPMPQIPQVPKNPFYENGYPIQGYENLPNSYKQNQPSTNIATSEIVLLSTIQKKLRQLENLYYQKVITYEELETKKREIILLEKRKFKI